MTSFQFIEATHCYLVAGREVPGCTRCLDHSGLVDFSMVRREILERKSALGREVHRIIQFHLEGDLDMESVDPEAMGYLVSWTKLQEHSQFTPLLIEHQQIAEIDGHLYGMKPDLAGRYMGLDSVLDLKIGAPQPWHGIQLAGYAAGLGHDTLTSIYAKFARRRRYTVHLKADGSMPKVVPWTESRDLQTFRSTVEITHRKMEWGKKIRPLEEPDGNGNDHD